MTTPSEPTTPGWARPAGEGGDDRPDGAPAPDAGGRPDDQGAGAARPATEPGRASAPGSGGVPPGGWGPGYTSPAGAPPGYGPSPAGGPSYAGGPSPAGGPSYAGGPSSGGPSYAGGPSSGGPSYAGGSSSGGPSYAGGSSSGGPSYAGASSSGGPSYGGGPSSGGGPTYGGPASSGGGPSWAGGPTSGAPGYPRPGGPGLPGYRPPVAAPRPGIVPLRPLGLGEILDGAFRAIRANPRVMFGLSAIVVAVTVAIQAVLQWYVGGLIAGELASLSSVLDPAGDLGVAETLAPNIALLLTAPLISVAVTVLTGLLIVSVSRSVIGQKISVGEVWAQARRRVLLLLLFSFATTTLIALVWGVLFGVVAFLGSNEQWPAAVVTGLVGGLVLLCATVWFVVRILLIPATLVLEGTSVGTALRRGWRLTRGSFWRLLGIYLLTSVMVGVVASLIATPATVISAFVLRDPLLTSFGSIVVTSVANVFAYTLTTSFMAAVVALLYVDVRMRREGLDVELARAAGEAA